MFFRTIKIYLIVGKMLYGYTMSYLKFATFGDEVN